MAFSRDDDRWNGTVLRIRAAAHFFERLDRLERLRLEAADSEIPEHRRAPRARIAAGRQPVERDVQDGLAVALHQSRRVTRDEGSRGAESDAVCADREIEAVGIPERGMMARRARDVFLARQDRIPEQQAPERDALGRGWIVRRRRRLRREGQRDEPAPRCSSVRRSPGLPSGRQPAPNPRTLRPYPRRGGVDLAAAASSA